MRLPTTTSPLLGLLALALAAGGCDTFRVRTPPQFVSLERARAPRYYKAVSPDNSVVTVSAFKHRDRGNLAYWTEILRREMTLQKGYTLLDAKPVKTARGLAGQQLAFTALSGAVKFRYVATLFVTRRWLYVIEAAAKAEVFPQHEAAFASVVDSFVPR